MQRRNISRITVAKRSTRLRVSTLEVHFRLSRVPWHVPLLLLGGYFPTPYTHQPELVMSDRRRSRDQYLYIPKYALNNTNVDRTNEIRKFHQVRCAVHRHR